MQIFGRNYQRLRAGRAEYPFDQDREQAAALLIGRQ